MVEWCRLLRLPVDDGVEKWRTGGFGPRTDGGARFVARLLTVTATGRRQERSVLDYLTAVCTAAQLGHPIPALLPVTA